MRTVVLDGLKLVFSVGRLHAAMILAVALCAAGVTCASASVVTVTTPLDSTSVASSESNFGDLVADAILASAPNADFAICPAAEINPTTIASGKVDTNTIVAALRAQSDPGDTVEVITLTGAQVRDAIAHALSRAPIGFQGFLQVSGLTIRFDLSKHDAGRVVSITDKTGRPLDPRSTYRVAVSHYLADGALGYFEIWSNAAVSDTGVTLTDAVVDFAVKHQPIDYHVEGRASKS